MPADRPPTNLQPGSRYPSRLLSRSETISDRPSSRVLAAPGGKQSFNIFGSEEPAPVHATPTASVTQVPVTAPQPGLVTGYGVSVAAGHRLPVRTEHTGISEHPSTLVHAPPGGKQSFNIFGGEEPVAAPPTARMQPAAPVAVAPVAPAAPVAVAAAPQLAAGQRILQRSEFHGIQDRNSTLVHAAPGGNDSGMAGLLGGSSAADRIAAMKAKREAPPAAPLAASTNVNPTRPW